MGRKRFVPVGFCRPYRGLDGFGDRDPRFHRGLLSAAPPALSFADARPQIFFQPGEGAFKDVVILPVREIGEVIFADFFRQCFAGVRVQAFPSFQRREIRQRDWEKFYSPWQEVSCSGLSLGARMKIGVNDWGCCSTSCQPINFCSSAPSKVFDRCSPASRSNPPAKPFVWLFTFISLVF